MPDNETKDKLEQPTKAAMEATVKPEPMPKPVRHPEPEIGDNDPTRHKLGLIEILFFVLLAGVMFLFVFGMLQHNREKKQEEALKNEIIALIPAFEQMAAEAREYKENDIFQAWPIDIGEFADPNMVDMPKYEFSWEVIEQTNDEGVLINEIPTIKLVTKESFGKAGIQVIYNLNDNEFSVADPSPEEKPVIKESWLN